MEQNNEFNDLGEKPIGQLLLTYAIPAIVAMAAASVYNIIDAIFIGQSVGPLGITGLALAAPFMSLTAAFGAMVGVGAATLMSVKLGQRDYGTAKSILGNLLIMNVALGLFLGIVLQIFLDPILRLFGASDETLPYAHDFMTVILTGNVVTHLYLGLNAMLRSTNRPRMAMYSTICTVVLNCCFAPLFIFVFGWGITGAATATILSQTIMLMWQFKLFSNKKDMIHINRDIIRLKMKIVGESLLIGLPPFLINLCACLVAVIVTRSMAKYGGDLSVGAFGIVNRVVLFIVMVVIGLDQGMQPIAGYNYGARNYSRVLAVLKKALIAGTVITTVGFVLGTFFAEPCVSLFAKNSPELVRRATLGFKTVVMFFPFVGIQIVTTAFFQSIGYAGKSIFLSLTRQLIFLLPSLLILPHFFDNPVLGVWHAMPLADALACVLAIVLLINQVKKFRALARQQALVTSNK